jgi:hypothetical protein
VVAAEAFEHGRWVVHVARFDADGRPDLAFGDGGKVIVDVPTRK